MVQQDFNITLTLSTLPLNALNSYIFAAELRECFPTSVLLGDIRNPLKKTEACEMRDISERGSNSNIFACLCTTNFCNSKDGAIGAAPSAGAVGPPRRQQQATSPPRTSALQSDRRQPQPLQSSRRPDPREPVTRRPSTQRKTTRRPSSMFGVVKRVHK